MSTLGAAGVARVNLGDIVPLVPVPRGAAACVAWGEMTSDGQSVLSQADQMSHFKQDGKQGSYPQVKQCVWSALSFFVPFK